MTRMDSKPELAVLWPSIRRNRNDLVASLALFALSAVVFIAAVRIHRASVHGAPAWLETTAWVALALSGILAPLVWTVYYRAFARLADIVQSRKENKEVSAQALLGCLAGHAAGRNRRLLLAQGGCFLVSLVGVIASVLCAFGHG